MNYPKKKKKKKSEEATAARGREENNEERDPRAKTVKCWGAALSVPTVSVKASLWLLPCGKRRATAKSISSLLPLRHPPLLLCVATIP